MEYWPSDWIRTNRTLIDRLESIQFMKINSWMIRQLLDQIIIDIIVDINDDIQPFKPSIHWWSSKPSWIIFDIITIRKWTIMTSRYIWMLKPFDYGPDVDIISTSMNRIPLMLKNGMIYWMTKFKYWKHWIQS